MKILVLLDGEKPTLGCLQKAMERNDVLYCADGAGNFLFAHGISPDVLIGDMDSIDSRVLDYYVNQKIEIARFQSEKDETDGQLIIDKAIAKKPEEITILGGLGQRFDHSLGNLQLLLRCEKAGVHASCISETEEVRVVLGTAVLVGEKGDTVSVIPLAKDTVMSTKGMKYEVKEFLLPLDTPIGISNVMEKEFGEITIHSGTAVIVHQKNY